MITSWPVANSWTSAPVASSAMAGHRLESGGDLVVTRNVEHDTAGIGLVQDTFCHHLEHDRTAQLGGEGDRLVCRGDRPGPDCGDAGACEQGADLVGLEPSAVRAEPLQGCIERAAPGAVIDIIESDQLPHRAIPPLAVLHRGGQRPGGPLGIGKGRDHAGPLRQRRRRVVPLHEHAEHGLLSGSGGRGLDGLADAVATSRRCRDVDRNDGIDLVAGQQFGQAGLVLGGPAAAIMSTGLAVAAVSGRCCLSLAWSSSDSPGSTMPSASSASAQRIPGRRRW